MKVLITGGCGFIGSFVAERFHKEGHQVSIIDNLTTGQTHHISFKHQLYTMNVEDPKCEEVFRSGKFDLVVHLAAQIDVQRSVKRPYEDAQSNMLGIANMLSLSAKHGVKKFIFASTAAVYGMQEEGLPLSEDTPCAPISPYGTHKWFGEQYCAKWQEMYGLDTLCFRFSNVYGPRQSDTGEGGVISIFLNKLMNGQELVVYGDGGQTRDFIYVEDVADAIYRGAYSDITGVFNLSTSTETSLNDLIRMLSAEKQTAGVRYLDARKGDIYRSSLDNTRLKRSLDWVPLYSVQEGLQKTIAWFEQRAETGPQREKKRFALPETWKKILPYVENIFLFAIVALVDSSLVFRYLSLDFMLFYIILIASLYGIRQSMISVCLAIVYYLYGQVAEGRELLSLVYDTEAFFQVAIYLFLGLIIGYTTDKRKTKIAAADGKMETALADYNVLKKVYEDTLEVKEQLQQQIVNSKDSLGRLYAIVRNLESLQPEEVVGAAVGVIEQLMGNRSVSIYSYRTNGFLRLMVRSNRDDFLLPKSLHVDDAPQWRTVVDEQNLFINRELAGQMPMMAAPIVHEGETVAVISLHEIEFERFTLYHEHLFKVASELISGSLARAFQFAGAVRSERYVEDSALLNMDAMQEMIEQKEKLRKTYNIHYALLEIRDNGPNWRQTVMRIAQCLRESDYIGLDRNRNIQVLLSNSTTEEAARVADRLSSSGIHAALLGRDKSYV
ncbi:MULTISPECIES: NAD-dependent epimerase/dehydratase family protein [unclassified Paenibacillus]|uniref:NAD-dependent epimerase/dehydratase family protein n=1 Tax=unclassified Paenibacillus TaxID=185978 RepID=UPI001C10ED29|nr:MULTISPECIES: NAD-dependent epimerase/dehydratase family protein [unclassified Paenibacillus]MBU5442406.1 NAD-dependent epimerase/dehydratase family protein [Paenibacillus sp. MSJ-34]CAH0119442.1 GDP-L-fucose synthase [Paenibacillus sp. CECT 9249]